ncbi:TrkA family potassium uptake protein [Leuconostoc falkenbergense]|jgi:trk system potassium uptake protein TrkA|uniref:TrkA family potassium uptake protein n=2 Tax=Leuconostoc TaxID=1243 RepID=A0A9X3E6P9_9LACO|nr:MULTISPECIES: TrkA family potassium uptake protein [Leuconostoc]KDA49510.1 Trk system potassium uptake protein TrkA [Leuconostoc pseudomesenteroides PS12]CCJ66193.1 Trk system potassium uptake protein TrkA [Leuconostoc pseudomesenteroides 4882]MCT4377737.1 TrkA family potassium uptake protein [Leuconostoc falkenbergense]MCT4389167.1 TrkA family potassium uptake protein [Leuconostoc falkenbergense]MCT4404990.1 TrkA family potassium uptake protein [Leuconostoc falkenbergense]
MKQTYAIIGLGRFGGALLQTLVANGQDVMGIDINEENVNDYRDIATQVVVADAQEDDVLRKLDIASFDHVIIAIGHNMQASILATINAKDLGAKNVIAKAENHTHLRVLTKIGADVVVQPEREMGERVARKLLAPNMLNFIELSDDYSMAEIQIVNPVFYGRSIKDLNIRKKFGLNVIAVRHDNEVIVAPEASYTLQEKDIVSVVGPKDMVDDFDQITNQIN